jgi:dienelactone hydrolase
MKRFFVWAMLVAGLLPVSVNCEAGAGAVWRANPVTNAVAVSRIEFQDPGRSRAVPVKIYAPESGPGPFPVILFSHGLGGSREGYGYLGRRWAAHGFVVIHLQHAGSDDSVWREVPLNNRMAAMRRAAAQPGNAVDRARDVSFVIDQLTPWAATNSAWRGRLDLSNIGMAGHSFGAHTTLTVAGAVYSGSRNNAFADGRVKAAIPMSAPVPTNRSRLDDVFAGVKIPCLHMTGTEDNSPIGDTRAEDRRLPYDHCRNSEQFLITFTGGDHAIFGGRERRFGGEKDAEFQQLIGQSALAFWDACLRGDATAQQWLRTEFGSVLGPRGKFEQKPKP